ncbi:MAG: hypothetical protein OEQ18_01595 [Gammaproteobacteria bacterium]|nr:hypothetical protein [Gammaproteobacteria bacterium]
MIQIGTPGLAVPKTVTVTVADEVPPVPERPAPTPAQSEKKFTRKRRLH